jgi:formylglycine-generating enzyme required for sulfatase activity
VVAVSLKKLGIYDMSGNVKEWCWDRYDEAYYKSGPADNPGGPARGNRRCYRGGSGMDPETMLRRNLRFKTSPGYKNFDMGLRLVKNTSGKLPEGMILVKGGTFKMGSSKGKYGEKVVHHVTLNNFYIGKFEVTQKDWKIVMGKNPSYRKGNTCPVNFVDWYKAIEYCNRRSRKEGLTPCYSGSGDKITCNFQADGYRLPTEAEWEYAARGGPQSRHYKYSGSNDPGEVAWYLKNIVIFYQPTAQKKPNELGIYDMSGNVWEWCWDWYDFDYYQNSPVKNPHGPRSGIRRVVRGGGFTNPEYSIRNAARYRLEPIRMSLNIGLRVVRNAK